MFVCVSYTYNVPIDMVGSMRPMRKLWKHFERFTTSGNFLDWKKYAQINI